MVALAGGRDLRAHPYIAPDRERRPTIGLDQRDRLVSAVGVDVGDDDGRSFTGQAARRGPPDAAAGTGDEDDVALVIEAHARSFARSMIQWKTGSTAPIISVMPLDADDRQPVVLDGLDHPIAGPGGGHQVGAELIEPPDDGSC